MATASPSLPDRRAQAATAYAELELPAFRGVPGWEFTPIDKLDLDAFPAAPGGAGEDPFGFADAARPSAEAPASEGPVVMPLADAAEQFPDLVAQHLGSVVTRRTPFTVRNDAHWTDGAFVYVPRNVTVDAPIVVTTRHEQPGTALHHRLLVILEEGAQATVWHDSQSAGEGEALLNGVVELAVGQNARLRFVDLQDVDERAWVFATQRATVDRDGWLDWITLGFGSGNGKVFQETQLAGPGAHGTVTGAYAARGRQHL